MHDVELLMCTRSDPQLARLLRQITDFGQPREVRTPLLPELRTIIAEELAGAAARWTPHYDLGLTTFAGASDYQMIEPADLELDEPADTPPRMWQRIAKGFTHLWVHRRLCEQLEDAQTHGARTLADAYARTTIEPRDLGSWFRLHPAPEVLTTRLRAAARAFLLATPEDSPDPALEQALIAARDARSVDGHDLYLRWSSTDAAEQRRRAVGVATIETPAEYEYTNVPPRILELLGNPFDPRV